MAELMHNPNFPLIGERFEDRDWRNEGRILHVLSFATNYGYEVRGMYRVEVIAAPKNPATVGRKYDIAATTLENTKRYRKVSH